MNNDMVVIVDDAIGGRCFVARVPIKAEQEVINLATCVVVGEATKYTIQTRRDSHIDGVSIRYLNHSCSPSMYINTESLKVVTRRPLAAGDPLTFFYPSTEWDMSVPFVCSCGTDHCIKQIVGAKHLSTEMLERHVVSNHIRTMLGERDAGSGNTVKSPAIV